VRWLYFVFLVAVSLVVASFVYQNREDLTLTVYDRAVTAPAAQILGAVYVLGMLTGWSVVGLLRRSLARATETPRRAV
jgi:drug/metabolite transporter (DMT)-like permease